MKLAVIILILTLCYCGSASQDRCSCLQPRESVSDNLPDMNLVQPRFRRDEQDQHLVQDPKLLWGQNKKKTSYAIGMGNPTGARLRRGFLNPDMIPLLREYNQQPEYIDS